jgi:hypothetical protein
MGINSESTLTEGRFLAFSQNVPIGTNSESTLTERRFRSYWDRTADVSARAKLAILARATREIRRVEERALHVGDGAMHSARAELRAAL